MMNPTAFFLTASFATLAGASVIGCGDYGSAPVGPSGTGGAAPLAGGPGASASGSPGVSVGGTPGASAGGSPGVSVGGIPGASVGGSPGASAGGSPGAPTGGAAPAGGGPGGSGAPSMGASGKPRIIVTQDGEIDDKSSMVRFLLYTSDFDVVGIVQNNSIYQKNGHSKELWIQKKIDLYAEALPNLRVHHPDFPDPAYLKSVTKVGNENVADLKAAPPDMATKDTEGSQLIIDTLLDSDPRDVHIPSWGGANTTAYALWKIKTTMPDKYAYAAKRVWIYGICYDLTTHAQDGGYRWIIDNLPEVKIYQATTWAGTWNYDSVDGMRNPSRNPKDIQAFLDPAWLQKNLKVGHGSLGASYPQSYISEGDTPGFLSLINNGLDSHLDYTYGGWAGRAKYKAAGKGYLVDAGDGGGTYQAIYRWIPAVQNDLQARMDWAVTPTFAGANHNPKAKVTGGTRRSVSGGETVMLDASETTDPDGDALTFKWWQYNEADSAAALVSISNPTAQTGASFTVPSEPGKEVHIILEVTDNGSPPLTNYQRVIVSIQ